MWGSKSGGAMLEQIPVKTSGRTQFVDISGEISGIVRKSGVKSGVCYVYVPHTTAAVTINENADPSVPSDILMEFNKRIPFEDGYTHMEGNSAAHIKSSIIGCSETVLIEGGSLVLGTWQGIFFCEFDGPRSRKVFCKVVEG